MRSVPAHVVGRDRRVVEPQKRFRDHRSVADPRSRIGSRSGPQHRSIARDEQVRKRGAQRVEERLGFARSTDSDAVEFLLPACSDRALLAFEPCGLRAAARCHVDRRRRRGTGERHDDPKAFAPMRCERHSVGEHGRGEPSVVVHGVSIAPVAAEDPGHRPGAEGEGPDAVGRPQREDLAHAVHRKRCAVPGDVANRADTANDVEELRRRIDLKRSHREHEAQRQRARGAIGQIVTCHELRARARSRGERRDAQLPSRILQPNAGHRQVAVDQEWLRLDVRPGCHVCIGHDERLDRESAAGDFERAVLGEEPGFLPAVDADERPVRLLAGEAAWIGTTRCLSRQRGDECIRRGAEREILDLHFGEAVVIGRPVEKCQTNEARFGVG